MAKRRRRTTTTKVIRVGAPRAANPIIKVNVPRASPARRAPRRRRIGAAVSRAGGIVSQYNLDLAIGGALYGFAVKSGWVSKLPAIPIVGRTGTAALLLDYWGKHGGGKYVQRAAGAAAVLAGYQLGSTGAITGDASPDYPEDDGYGVSGGIQTMGDDDDDE